MEINKDILKGFLDYCGRKSKDMLGLDSIIDTFLIKLENGLFEIPRCGKMEYKQLVLMAFVRYKFHSNFTSYSLTYYPKIYPYLCKITYGVKNKIVQNEKNINN